MFAQEHGDVLQEFLREKLGALPRLEQVDLACVAEQAPSHVRRAMHQVPPRAGDPVPAPSSVATFFRWVWDKLSLTPRLPDSLWSPAASSVEEARQDAPVPEGPGARHGNPSSAEFIGTATASLAILIVVYVLYIRQRSA